MPQERMTYELAGRLAEMITSQKIVTLDVERATKGKHRGHIMANWTEGDTISVEGESFAAEVLNDLVRDSQTPGAFVKYINIKKTSADDSFVATYAVSRSEEKSNAHK